MALVAVRRLGISKVFAACLIALTVSPFTAPFSTFDKAEILGETAVYAGHGTAKLVQEHIDLGWVAASVSAPFVSALCQVAGRVLRVDVRLHRSLVLRI